MKGKRIFDRFGFDLPKNDKIKNFETKLLSSFDEWEYNSEIANWENTKLDKVLCDFQTPTHLTSMLQYNINTDLE